MGWLATNFQDRILAIKTDAVVFTAGRKKTRRLCEELEAVTYDSVHLTTRRPLTQYIAPLQDPIKSKEPIFQLREVPVPGKKGELQIHPCPHPVLDDPQWDMREEKPGDDMVTMVCNHVASGKTFCCTGAPGTGKSFLLAKIQERLQSMGERVEVLAPSNAAARIVHGQTCHHFIAKMGSSTHGWKGWLLIDELSMLSLALITVMDNLRLGGCKICLFGDWDQLPAVGQSWRGKNLDPKVFQHSNTLKRWSCNTLFRLTTCHRSDATHFQFYTELSNTDLATAIRWTRAAYRQSSDADIHFVVSHRKRRALNEEAQKEFAHGLVETLHMPAVQAHQSWAVPRPRNS